MLRIVRLTGAAAAIFAIWLSLLQSESLQQHRSLILLVRSAQLETAFLLPS